VICPPCRASLHKSCMGCDCKHGITTDATQDAITPHVPVEQVEEEEVNERLAPSKRQRSLKRDATLKDQQSTGRKRAARMYPLSPDAPCDWNSTLVNSHSPRPQTDDERQQAILDELVYHGSKQTPVRD
jgi:hypothetical protein